MIQLRGPMVIYGDEIAGAMDTDFVCYENDANVDDSGQEIVQELVLAWVGDPNSKLAGLRFRHVGAIVEVVQASYLSVAIRVNHQSDTIAGVSAVKQTIEEQFPNPDFPFEVMQRLWWRLKSGARVVSSMELTIRDDIAGASPFDPRVPTTTVPWSLKEIEFDLAARPKALGRRAPVPSGS